ncbi:uncharacterized protein LOC143367922 [Andrena cerasifolii]|uniref:uncharacterized protein LOC143367922 n=1 Tax=Andrena cerasifolii TaxID=2819439 RepID=UPI0040377CE8
MNYYQDMELMEENKQPELNTRKFTIYIQINDRQLIKMSDLDISEYLKLKNDDEYILQYCQDNYNEEIVNLFRSSDDVNYTAVPVPMIELQLTEITEDIDENCENIQQNIDLSIEEMDISNNRM